jgi:hypothetical protein
MTPLALLADARLARQAPVVLASRPTGVLHAFSGPLTPTGRSPRGARPVCGTRTRTLRAIPLSEVRRLRVCERCHAHLDRLGKAGGVGTQPPSRGQLLAAYAGVTSFDLAVDAWRAETVEDVERVEHLALLLVGIRAAKTEPVVSPDGKVTGPLDEHLSNARRRLGIVRDPLAGPLRAAAIENEDLARHAAKERRKQGWLDREARIERLGIVNATARPRTA